MVTKQTGEFLGCAWLWVGGGKTHHCGSRGPPRSQRLPPPPAPGPLDLLPAEGSVRQAWAEVLFQTARLQVNLCCVCASHCSVRARKGRVPPSLSLRLLVLLWLWVRGHSWRLLQMLPERSRTCSCPGLGRGMSTHQHLAIRSGLPWKAMILLPVCRNMHMCGLSLSLALSPLSYTQACSKTPIQSRNFWGPLKNL
jgi:hypothetical protein